MDLAVLRMKTDDELKEILRSSGINTFKGRGDAITKIRALIKIGKLKIGSMGVVVPVIAKSPLKKSPPKGKIDQSIDQIIANSSRSDLRFVINAIGELLSLEDSTRESLNKRTKELILEGRLAVKDGRVIIVPVKSGKTSVKTPLKRMIVARKSPISQLLDSPESQSPKSPRKSPKGKSPASPSSAKINVVKTPPKASKQATTYISGYDDLEASSDYHPIKKLGEGVQGEVILVENDAGERYAVKIYSYNIQKRYFPRSKKKEDTLIVGNDEAGLTDVYFSLLVNHPYVVNSREVIVGEDNMYLIMDLADSDLKTRINKKKFTPEQKLRAISQLTNAVMYFHANDLVHCDLKAVNTLVKGDNVMIADLGLMRFKEDTYQRCQTSVFKAPEVYKPDDEKGFIDYNFPSGTNYIRIFGEVVTEEWREQTQASEMWSFGILCLEIIYNTPFITTNERINTSVVGKPLRRSTAYQTFLEVLISAYDKKSPNYQKRPYQLIVGMLGEVSVENQPLLELVCNNLLIVNQAARVYGFINFAQSDLFPFQTVARGLYQNVDVMFREIPDMITVNGLNHVVSRMIVPIHNAFKLPFIVTMNAIDYIIQNSSRSELVGDKPFGDTEGDYGLFVGVVMWMFESIFSHGRAPTPLSVYTDRAAKKTLHKGIRVLKAILKADKGLIKYDSLYHRLPSEQLVRKGMILMTNTPKYIQLGSPKNAANFLIREETAEEFQDRTVKVMDHVGMNIKK